MFAAGIAALYNSEKYSDLQIVCGDKTFKVHKTVVCTQSDYFARMVESQFLEASTGLVTLQEDDPEDIGRMVSFLYTSEYDDVTTVADYLLSPTSPSPFKSPEPNPVSTMEFFTLQSVLTNVAMYALGEKYLIPHLKIYASNKFSCLLPENWKHGISEVLAAVYSSTPQSDRGLRNPLVSLCQDLGYQDQSLIRALDEVPDAHVDVLKEMLSAKEVSIVELRSMVDNTSRAMEEDGQKISTLIEEKTKLQAGNRRLQSDNRRLRTENRNLNDDKTKLTDDLAHRDAENLTIQAQNNELHIQITGLQSENQDLRTQRDELDSKVTGLSFRLGAAEARLTEDPLLLNVNLDQAPPFDPTSTLFPDIPFPTEAVMEPSPGASTSKWSVESMINKIESGHCLHCGKDYNVYLENGKTIYEPCCEACRSPLHVGGANGSSSSNAIGNEIDMTLYQ